VRVARHARANFVLPGGDSFADLVPTCVVRTGPDGRFTCGGLPAGRLEVSVRASGRAAALVPVRLAAGEARQVDVRMRPGCAVRGVVRDAGGEPIAGASVVAHGRARYEWCGVETAADGGFWLDGVSVERIVLEVEADGCVLREVPLPPGGGRPVDVVLGSLPRVRGRLVGATGAAIEPAAWQLGYREQSTWARRSPAPVALGDEGSFEVAAGPDAAFFCRPVENCVWLPCVARPGAGGAVELAVPEPADCTVELLFTGFTREQLRDAQVWLTRDGEVYCLRDPLAELGGRACCVLPAGDYEILLMSPGGTCPPLSLGNVPVRAPHVRREVAAPPSGNLCYRALQAGCSVERWHGFVVDADGVQSPLAKPCGTIALAAGRYTLWASGLTFMTVRGLEFDVHAGAETRLDVPLRSGLTRHVAFVLPAGVVADEAAAFLRRDGDVVMGAEPGLRDRGFDAPADGYCCVAVVLADGPYELELIAGERRWLGAFTVGGEEGVVEPIDVALRFVDE
jgi:hypothetical protein